MADVNANLIWKGFKTSLVNNYQSMFQKFPRKEELIANYKQSLEDPIMHCLVSKPIKDYVFLRILENMESVPIADKLLFIVLIGM